MVILEERVISGRINKNDTSKLTQLYQQFMDYCQAIKEPLKIYFQEKLEYLFLNEKICQMLIKENNRAQVNESTEILSNSFLKFSEIQNKNDNIMESYIKNKEEEAFKENKDVNVLDFESKFNN